MSKLDKFILHIPLIGLMLMLVMMNSSNDDIKNITYNEIKMPVRIQIFSIAIFVLLMTII